MSVSAAAPVRRVLDDPATYAAPPRRRRPGLVPGRAFRRAVALDCIAQLRADETARKRAA